MLRSPISVKLTRQSITSDQEKHIRMIVSFCAALIAAQCFVFPYDAENEFIRILQAVEGIAVFTMLIVLVYRIWLDLCGAKADKIRA